MIELTLKEKIEDFYWDLSRPFRNALSWIRHRTWDKYHVLQTGLRPGYQDADVRMLHANFSLLVDYVEVELAWLYRFCFNTKENPLKVSFWKRKFGGFRNAEWGLTYLKDGIQQKPEDETNKIEVLFWEKEITRCQKILDLYTWWTVDRPARKDPYDEVDRLIQEHKEKTGENCHTIHILTNKKLPVKISKAYKKAHKETDRQYEEDTQKLVELIKLRGYLWS